MIRPFLLIGSIGVLLSAPLRGATYDWFSATDGGLWSLSANWTPAGGPPVTGDIVNLTDATADRTVTYDPAASGTVGTINFNQTSAFTNTLVVQRALTVTNAITLGSETGTEELRIVSLTDTSSTNTLTAPGITLNKGGRLVLGLGLSNVSVTRFVGNVTINQGELVVTDSLAPKDAAQRSISGSVTATGGSIAIGASQITGTREARLSIGGDFLVTGTAISGSGDAQLILEGATNIIGAGSTFANPGTGANTITTVLSGGRNQSLTSEIKLSNLFFRQLHDGTLIKTVSVADQSGPNVAALQFAGRNNQTIGLKLGSNLKTGSGTQHPFMSGVTQTNVNARFSIDTNSFTLELGNTGSSWAPALSGGAATALWSLINSGTPGEGGIKVRGVEFNRPGVTVDVGAGMVLDLTGDNGIASNLGTAGTIHNTSTIRYSGPAAAATPATLASGRAVGQIEVGNGTTSGALKLAGNLTANGLVTVNNLGSLDLGTQELTANSGISVESGGILRGGTETAAGMIMGDLSTAGILAPGTSPSATGATIGTLFVSGQLMMESGSMLALEIISGSSFDKAMAGSVSLNGTVNLSLSLSDSYVHSPGSAFVLLENFGGGEIDGFFTWGGPEGLLSEGETFLVGSNPFKITYRGGVDDNDVVITAMVPEPSAVMALVCGAGLMLGLRRARGRR